MKLINSITVYLKMPYHSNEPGWHLFLGFWGVNIDILIYSKQYNVLLDAVANEIFFALHAPFYFLSSSKTPPWLTGNLALE